jgi:hypothetical protein
MRITVRSRGGSLNLPTSRGAPSEKNVIGRVGASALPAAAASS